MAPTNKNSICMRLLGGLGNQLFQFSAGYALSKEKGVPLVLDASSYASDELRKLEITNFSLPEDIKICRTINPAISKKIKPWHLSYWRQNQSRMLPYKEKRHCFDPSIFSINQTAYLKGYFQSPLYFDGYRNDLRDIFKLKSTISASSQNYLDAISAAATSVSVHIRRGDFLSKAETHSSHGVLDRSYYDQALDLLRKLYGRDVQLFFFTDDPDWIEEAFSDIQNAQAVRGNGDHPWEDLYLMAQCDHNIIANSTFSWWGAWLNDNEEKTVIAPRHWFSRDKHCQTPTFDMFPDGWITL
jgi:hypothetical protein